MTIKIGVFGSSGRMGNAVIEAVFRQSNRFSLAAKFTRNNSINTLEEFCLLSDIIIDFSSPGALPDLLAASVKSRKKLLIGTTGLSAKNMLDIEKAAKSIAILYAANTSLGSNIIIEMAGRMAQILKDYDAEIIDFHHKYKKDAPSGTAIAIGKNIASARAQKYEHIAVFNRIDKGPRKDGEIGFSSVRGGGVYGEHEVIFASDSEIITIGSRALTRGVFADGALFAAHWLNSQPPGLYSMKDVLNI